MIPTERLYYTDSYRIRLESRVVAASEDRLRITLAQTAFYPTSGGQPHDFGTLNSIPVIDVVDEGETITHVLSAPLADENVTGEIDWNRRYDHMQQHTGQHLLSSVFEQLFQISTLSFRMGQDLSTIELGSKELTGEQLKAAILRATELARANPPVIVSFEDAADAQWLRKASAREGTLRVIEISGIDRSACGGTHVATLAEVLPIQIRDSDRVRGNVRISFACGNRALARSQMDFETLSRIAKTLATTPERVESHIVSLQQRLADTDKQKQRLETEAATRAGIDLYNATSPSQDRVRRVLVAEILIDENARTKARAFAAQPKSILLMHSDDGLLLACSPDSGLNAGATLKQALAKAGARGGGSATLAQGNLPDKAILQDLIQTLGLP